MSGTMNGTSRGRGDGSDPLRSGALFHLDQRSVDRIRFRQPTSSAQSAPAPAPSVSAGSKNVSDLQLQVRAKFEALYRSTPNPMGALMSGGPHQQLNRQLQHQKKHLFQAQHAPRQMPLEDPRLNSQNTTSAALKSRLRDEPSEIQSNTITDCILTHDDSDTSNLQMSNSIPSERRIENRKLGDKTQSQTPDYSSKTKELPSADLNVMNAGRKSFRRGELKSHKNSSNENSELVTRSPPVPNTVSKSSVSPADVLRDKNDGVVQSIHNSGPSTTTRIPKSTKVSSTITEDNIDGSDSQPVKKGKAKKRIAVETISKTVTQTATPQNHGFVTRSPPVPNSDSKSSVSPPDAARAKNDGVVQSTHNSRPSTNTRSSKKRVAAQTSTHQHHGLDSRSPPMPNSDSKSSESPADVLREKNDGVIQGTHQSRPSTNTRSSKKVEAPSTVGEYIIDGSDSQRRKKNKAKKRVAVETISKTLSQTATHQNHVLLAPSPLVPVPNSVTKSSVSPADVSREKNDCVVQDPDDAKSSTNTRLSKRTKASGTVSSDDNIEGRDSRLLKKKVKAKKQVAAETSTKQNYDVDSRSPPVPVPNSISKSSVSPAEVLREKGDDVVQDPNDSKPTTNTKSSKRTKASDTVSSDDNIKGRDSRPVKKKVKAKKRVAAETISKTVSQTVYNQNHGFVTRSPPVPASDGRLRKRARLKDNVSSCDSRRDVDDHSMDSIRHSNTSQFDISNNTETTALIQSAEHDTKCKAMDVKKNILSEVSPGNRDSKDFKLQQSSQSDNVAHSKFAVVTKDNYQTPSRSSLQNNSRCKISQSDQKFNRPTQECHSEAKSQLETSMPCKVLSSSPRSLSRGLKRKRPADSLSVFHLLPAPNTPVVMPSSPLTKPYIDEDKQKSDTAENHSIGNEVALCTEANQESNASGKITMKVKAKKNSGNDKKQSSIIDNKVVKKETKRARGKKSSLIFADLRSSEVCKTEKRVKHPSSTKIKSDSFDGKSNRSTGENSKRSESNESGNKLKKDVIDEKITKERKKRSKPTSSSSLAPKTLSPQLNLTNEWNGEEIKMLKSAHRKCPVTAVDFWEQVACEYNNQTSKKTPGIAARTALGCQIQWFKAFEKVKVPASKKTSRAKKKEVKPNDVEDSTEKILVDDLPENIKNSEIENEMKKYEAPPAPKAKKTRQTKAQLQKLLEKAFKGDADDIFETSYFGDQKIDIPDISLNVVSNLESPKEIDRYNGDGGSFFGTGEGMINQDAKDNSSKTWRTNYVNKMKSDMKTGRSRGVKEMSASIRREEFGNISTKSTVRGNNGRGKKNSKTFDSGQTSLGQGRGNANVKAKIGRHGKVSVTLEHDDSDLSDFDIENDLASDDDNSD